MTNEELMEAFKEMNYTDLEGAERDTAIEAAEDMKNTCWNRGRPGKHDDVATEDIDVGAVTSHVDTVVAQRKAEKDRYKAELARHAEQVKAEAERLKNGERPPNDWAEVHKAA
jgi:hypothetical protein